MKSLNYIKHISLCFLGLLVINCVKTEPLDIEKDYKQQLTQRAQQEQQREAEAKAKAEAEAQKKWEAYYKMLTEYKQKAWANTGEKPFIYMWWTGWRAADGLERTWLQSIPDTTTAISLWGGYGKQPADMTDNEKYDLEVFHKKGSKVFLCWQVSNVGQGLPNEGNKSGFTLFREKYGEEKDSDNETYRCQIYARELARYIIACGLDGFDIDWEPTIGNHNHYSYNEFASGSSTNGYKKNMDTFIREIGKYFGEKYSGKQRKQHLRELFDENHTGYHQKEKEYIKAYKPFFEKGNYAEKKYCLLFDGQYEKLINTDDVDSYISKYIMQDYGDNRVDSPFTSNPYKSVSTSEFEKGSYLSIIVKAKATKIGKVGGVGSYHGELDYSFSAESSLFKGYMESNKISGRKYKHYAWLREAIRIIDPRSNEEYKDFKEEITINKPNKK
ncbi:endoglycosidase [Capnocytophaga ochracea]|nr:endoglycosidase [Capnocytophaga ochracea]UZD38234.1 endoglycosidase [Capnocytophaga ochracea]